MKREMYVCTSRNGSSGCAWAMVRYYICRRESAERGDYCGIIIDAQRVVLQMLHMEVKAEEHAEGT